jgi:hypothetical protein
MRTYEDTGLKALCESLERCGEIHAYRYMKYTSGADADHQWTTLTTPEEGIRSISYGDIQHTLALGFDAVTWEWMFEPKYMTYSDYSGSTVERANCKEFLERFKDVEGVYETTGGYGTKGVAISLSAITGEMIDLFDELDGYPVIDDEALSEVEMELESEDWDSWISYDFRKAIQKKFNQDEDDPTDVREDQIDAITDDQLYELYRERCDKTSTYWSPESAVGGYVDIDRLVEDMTIADLPEAEVK